MGLFAKVADQINVWSVDHYKKKKQEHEAYLEKTIGTRAVTELLKESQRALEHFSTQVTVLLYCSAYLNGCEREQLDQYLPKANEQLKDLGWMLVPNTEKNKLALRAGGNLYYADLVTLE